MQANNPRRIIVDNNDVVIGHKKRGSITSSDTYRVSALWLYNSQGEVLIAQRTANKRNDPGKWGPSVAGTLEEGETYESNILKEAQEEIGIVLGSITKGPRTRMATPRSYFAQWFAAELDAPESAFKLQKDEVAAVRWVTIEQLEADVSANPDKYIPGMARSLKLLKKTS